MCFLVEIVTIVQVHVSVISPLEKIHEFELRTSVVRRWSIDLLRKLCKWKSYLSQRFHGQDGLLSEWRLFYVCVGVYWPTILSFAVLVSDLYRLDNC